MRLSSVDLPAFGRPTSATMPNFGSLLDIFLPLDVPLGVARGFHAIDALAVGAVDLEDPSVVLHLRADDRDATQRREDQSSHRLVILPLQVGVELVLERVDAQQAAD